MHLCPENHSSSPCGWCQEVAVKKSQLLIIGGKLYGSTCIQREGKEDCLTRLQRTQQQACKQHWWLYGNQSSHHQQHLLPHHHKHTANDSAYNPTTWQFTTTLLITPPTTPPTTPPSTPETPGTQLIQKEGKRKILPSTGEGYYGLTIPVPSSNFCFGFAPAW